GWMAPLRRSPPPSGAAAHGGRWNRFVDSPRWLAATLLILLFASMFYGGLGHVGTSHIRAANSTAMQANGLIGDHALYSEIARRVHEVEPYYQAALAEQRENHYPTRPLITIRLHTYTFLLAMLGEKTVAWIGFTLGGLAIVLWA